MVDELRGGHSRCLPSPAQRGHVVPRRKVWLAGLVGLLATSGTLVAAGSATASATPKFTGAPVVIGYEGCETGYLSASDYYLPKMSQLAVNKINAAGGVLGHKIILDSLDTQCVATNEITDANQLIDQDHAVAITGGYQSAAIQGLIPTVEADHVPFVAAGTLLTQSPWGITIFPPNGDIANTLVGFLKEKFPKDKTLANVSGNTPYGIAVQQDVQGAANPKGISTTQQEISNTATDATPILQQTSADSAFFTNTSGPINLIIAANAQSLGWNKPLIFSDTRVDCIPMQQKYTNGMIYCIGLFSSLDHVVHNATLRANMNAALSLWRKAGQTITTFAPAAWDQIYLIVDAMKKADTVTNGTAIEKALSSESLTGAGGVYKFNPGYSFGVKGNPYDMASPTSNSMTLDFVPATGY